MGTCQIRNPNLPLRAMSVRQPVLSDCCTPVQRASPVALSLTVGVRLLPSPYHIYRTQVPSYHAEYNWQHPRSTSQWRAPHPAQLQSRRGRQRDAHRGHDAGGVEERSSFGCQRPMSPVGLMTFVVLYLLPSRWHFVADDQLGDVSPDAFRHTEPHSLPYVRRHTIDHGHSV